MQTRTTYSNMLKAMAEIGEYCIYLNSGLIMVKIVWRLKICEGLKTFCFGGLYLVIFGVSPRL